MKPIFVVILSFVLAAILGWTVAAAMSACAPSSQPNVPGPVVDTGSCVFRVISQDMLSRGMTFDQAVADAEIRCFGAVSPQNEQAVRDLWQSARAAFARIPADAGAP